MGRGTTNPKMRSRLRELLAARGWTQADLARAIGTTPKMVGRWATGEGWPAMEWALKIARALDVPVEEIIVLDGRWRASKRTAGTPLDRD